MVRCVVYRSENTFCQLNKNTLTLFGAVNSIQTSPNVQNLASAIIYSQSDYFDKVLNRILQPYNALFLG